MVVIICAIGLLVGLAVGQTVLITSNLISVTVTQQTITYSLVLTINETSAVTYSGVVHPGDKLVLVANATSVPPGYAAGKTVTFYNNTNHQIGSPIIADLNGLASLIWTVPALTNPPNNDVYVYSATLT